MSDMPWRSLRAASRLLGRKLELEVEGREHLPRKGPVVVAARHYHHLYDGVALLLTIPRPAHALVALDWTSSGAGRALLGRLCASARWPAVYRTGPHATPADPKESQRALRRAINESVAILRDGRPLIVFPEGFPTIDPNPTPKTGPDDWLPFQPGFIRIAEIAERSGAGRIPLLPAGFAYTQLDGDRWRATLRFGEPHLIAGDRAAAASAIEQRVRELSRP